MTEPSVAAVERVHKSTTGPVLDTLHALSTSSSTSTIGVEIEGLCFSRNGLFFSN